MSAISPANLKRFRYSSLFLVLLSGAASLLLAAYVLLIGNLLVHRPDSNALEQIALDAANKLSQITVVSPYFGRVGLCDLPSEENGNYLDHHNATRITGINNLYGILRLDALIANKLHHPTINALLWRDFANARKLEKELTIKLKNAVESRPVQLETKSHLFGFQTSTDKKTSSNSIYEEAYNNFSKVLAVRDSKLINLTIKLGFVRSRLAKSLVKAPIDNTENMSIDANGDYIPSVPVFIPGTDPIMFTTLINKTSNIETADFVEDARSSVPPAVLVEATYEFKPIEHKAQPLQISRTACAAVGSPPLPQRPAALVVSFPQGSVNLFHSIKEILDFKDWKNNGIWRQATKGAVPGLTGTLTPPSDSLLGAMSPGDALAVTIYHWLKLLSPNADIDKCVKYLSAHWTIPSAEESRTDSYTVNTSLPFANSCLARDSESSSSAILDQAYPGGPGQIALSDTFSRSELNPSTTLITAPPSALPLCVDNEGVCNLAGTRGFNEKLIKNFLTAVYDTNLAALESIWTAKFISNKYTSQKPGVEEVIAIEKQELSSLNNRINRLANKTILQNSPTNQNLPIENSHQIDLLNERIIELKTKITLDEAQLIKLNRLTQLAKIAADNARRAADSTYDLCAHAFKLCRNGVAFIEGGAPAYLIGQKLCFFPYCKPLTEADFLSAVSPPAEEQNQTVSTRIQPWLSESMQVTQNSNDFANSKNPNFVSLAMKINSLKPAAPITINPISIVVDSQLLYNSRDKQEQTKTLLPAKGGKRIREKIEPRVYTNYPFFNIFVPHGQLLYYCRHAAETGAKPVVAWSVLIRDLVAHSNEEYTGLPVNSLEQDWCNKQTDSFGACPGLACEFQLRTPLPVLINFPTGSYVSDSAGQRVSQLPPIPAEML